MANELGRGPLGVRKVSEKIVQEGRALIVTDKDAVKWEDIPFGALRIDPKTNKFYVKSYDDETDWTPVEFGTYIPTPEEPQLPEDIWTPGIDIPLGNLTKEEAESYAEFYENRIKDIERLLSGSTTMWVFHINLSDRVRQTRTKIIDIFEGIYSGSSLVFSSLSATNMEQAFNAIKTGGDALIEIISGMTFGDLNMIRLRLNELYEIVYPEQYIVNEFITADELAYNVAELYEIIGNLIPEELEPENVSKLTDDAVGLLLTEHLDVIETIYYQEVIQAKFASTMRSLSAEPEPEANTDQEKEDLLDRIKMLEEQVALLAFNQ